MEKPSCINKLKQLANSLTDEDFGLKEYMFKIKNIIDDKNLNDSQKIEKIKQIYTEYVR